MPDSWCAECERAECSCEPVELHLIAEDEDGDEVRFSVSLSPKDSEDEDAVRRAIDDVCRSNGWDLDSVEDSPYA